METWVRKTYNFKENVEEWERRFDITGKGAENDEQVMNRYATKFEVRAQLTSE